MDKELNQSSQEPQALRGSNKEFADFFGQFSNSSMNPGKAYQMLKTEIEENSEILKESDFLVEVLNIGSLNNTERAEIISMASSKNPGLITEKFIQVLHESPEPPFQEQVFSELIKQKPEVADQISPEIIFDSLPRAFSGKFKTMVFEKVATKEMDQEQFINFADYVANDWVMTSESKVSILSSAIDHNQNLVEPNFLDKVADSSISKGKSNIVKKALEVNKDLASQQFVDEVMDYGRMSSKDKVKIINNAMEVNNEIATEGFLIKVLVTERSLMPSPDKQELLTKAMETNKKLLEYDINSVPEPNPYSPEKPNAKLLLDTRGLLYQKMLKEEGVAAPQSIRKNRMKQRGNISRTPRVSSAQNARKANSHSI